MSTYNWGGCQFSVYDLDADWNDVGGIYIFAKRRLTNLVDPWLALYVGQAKSFADRIPAHEVWPGARDAAVTHVHALVEDSVSIRTSIERGLIQEYQPPLNDRGKQSPSDLAQALADLQRMRDRL